MPTGGSLRARKVVQTVLSQEQDEGVGARVRRSVGRPELRNLDPFLMLDEAKVTHNDGTAGFPDHPHRGFETVTYVMKGQVEHEDFTGTRGVIGPGDLQWMTAGRGIVHCEMPKGSGPMHLLQLWVNLKHSEKLCEPAYQELSHKDIPTVTKDGVTAKVFAGQALGITSQVFTRTPTMYSDFEVQPGAVLNHEIPSGWTAFAYSLEGEGFYGPSDNSKAVGPHHTVVFDKHGDGVRVENKGSEMLHFVVVAGEPIAEPIKQYGPFVMCTDTEIQQALEDYRQGKNGFEKARTWKSFVYRS